MRISCPSCQSRYTIADEKVQGRTVKVRCRKCGFMIHVNEHGVANDASEQAAGETPAAESAAAESAAADVSTPMFSVLVAEGDQRDMSLKDVVAAYNSGLITADTFVWADGQPDWMALAQLPVIVDALNAASAAVDAQASQATGQAAPAEQEPLHDEHVASSPMSLQEGTPSAEPSPATSSPLPTAEPAAPAPLFGSAPTATPQPVSNPGALFGGAAATATPAPVSNPGALFGGAPATATPAPVSNPGPLFGGVATATPAPLGSSAMGASVQTAAVRGEKRSQSVDLFGAQRKAGNDDEVKTSAPSLKGVVTASRSAAPREEQSVLFSLSALTAAAQSAPVAQSEPEQKVDSGLIDLRALANQSNKPQNEGPVRAAPVAILDAAPILGTPIVDPTLTQPATTSLPVPAKQSSKGLMVGLIAGISIAGVLIAGAIVYAVTRPPAVVPTPVATTPEQVNTAPTQTAAPTNEPPSTAAVPATGAPTSTAPASGTKGSTVARPNTGKGAKGAKGQPTGGTAKTSEPEPPKTPPKKPPASKCGCAANDLACNMACAAK